mgnify:FL=1
MKVLFVQQSGNQKLGGIPMSITEKKSCPTSCPLKGDGCYAELGRVNLHWTKVSKSRKKKYSWNNFLKGVRGLWKGQLWRLNVAGDLPGVGNNIDKRKLLGLINANKGKRGFGFTHKPVLGSSKQAQKNRDLIKLANEKGLIINLSANDLRNADDLYNLGVASVVCVVASDHPKHSLSPGGRKGLVCPQQTIGLTCDKCMLCANPKRKSIILFRAHGVSKNKVSQRATLPIVD